MALSTLEASQLIKKYKETGDKDTRNKIILCYGDLVKYIALSLRNVYLKYAEVDDIVNEGMLALMSSIDSYDIEKNVKFETYASIRIRGHIIDFIRKQDFIPRKIRTFSKEYDKALSYLYSQKGEVPTDAEIASYMNLSENKMLSLLSETASSATLSFEEMIYDNNIELTDDKDDSQWQAEREILYQEKKSQLIKALDELKDKERLVITLYYYEKLKFSDIAKVIEVSESRVCQIHSMAVKKLKNSLIDYMIR